MNLASISEIQYRVAEMQAANNNLRNELYLLESGINNAREEWNRLTGRINNTLISGNGRVSNSHELTLNAYELQCDIERLYKLFKYMESANKKIRELNNKIYYDFANYNAVRKIVEAMLNNVEVAFVSDAVLTKAIEVKHLQLPDYWLTCALLAIMAWRNDDRVLAEKALERACMLDQKNAAVFFFAFHMRIGRDSTALQWFHTYIACDLTGEDSTNILFMFSLLSKTTECDDRTYAAVNDFVNGIIQERLHSEGYSEQTMAQRIVGYYDRFRIEEPMDYPLLKKYCKETELLQQILDRACNNRNILDFIRKTVNITATEKNNRLNSFIDDVIRRSNKSEVDVRNEIHYNELVIAHKGDVDKAKEEQEAWLLHNRNQLDIIGEIVDWVYAPGSTEINAVEKQRLFIVIKTLSEKAADIYAEQYRSRVRHDLDIQIEEYVSHADLTNEAEEYRKIDQYFETKAADLMAQQKIWPSFLWFGAGVLSLAGAIALHPALFVVSAAGVLGGVGHILLTGKRKKQIASSCRREADNTKAIFSRLKEDYQRYQEEYASYDSYYDAIKEEFAKL